MAIQTHIMFPKVNKTYTVLLVEHIVSLQYTLVYTMGKVQPDMELTSLWCLAVCLEIISRLSKSAEIHYIKHVKSNIVRLQIVHDFVKHNLLNEINGCYCA